jgi:hypothetical protein
MRQSRISELENVNYNAWSISTLRRIAKALGVRLFFGFESWDELLPEVSGFNRVSLQKPKFEDDNAFKKVEKIAQPRRRRRRRSDTRNTELPRRYPSYLRGLESVNHTQSQPDTVNENLNNYMTDGKPKPESSLDKMALGFPAKVQKLEAA